MRNGRGNDVGSVAYYVLTDQADHKLRFPVNQFPRDNEWAPILLAAAAKASAYIDPQAREALEQANGTFRRRYGP